MLQKENTRTVMRSNFLFWVSDNRIKVHHVIFYTFPLLIASPKALQTLYILGIEVVALKEQRKHKHYIMEDKEFKICQCIDIFVSRQFIYRWYTYNKQI